MTANINSQKTTARLKRIKIVSWILRAAIWLYVVMLVMLTVSCISSGLPNNPEGIAPSSLAYFLHHYYIKPSPTPFYMAGFAMVRLGLFAGGLFFFDRLFLHFSRGKIFAAENVRCVRWIGLMIMLDVLPGFLIALTNRHVDFNPQWLVGLFVLLISWIADEGRKIQEEQELTV